MLIIVSFLFPSLNQAKTQLHSKVKRLGYVEAFNNESQAWHLKLALDSSSQYTKNFYGKINASVLGLFPREAADWWDLKQAYVGVKQAGLDVKLGRVLPKWGVVEGHSVVGRIFPSFSIDPLSSSLDGWMGLASSYKDENGFKLDLLLSPLFMPDMGGVRYETDDNDHFYSKSRWSLPVYYQLKVGEGWLPLDYTLHMPNVTDVLFKNSLAYRISYAWPQVEVALVASTFINPEVQLTRDAYLYIKNENYVEGRVHLYPEFKREQMMAVEAKLDLKVLRLLSEAAVQKNTFRNLFALESNRNVVGIQLENHLKEEVKADVIMVERPKNYWFSKVNFKPFSWLGYSVESESDLKLDSFFVTQVASLQFSKDMNLSVGLNMIYGKPETYWGHFREFDSVWMEAKVAF